MVILNFTNDNTFEINQKEIDFLNLPDEVILPLTQSLVIDIIKGFFSFPIKYKHFELIDIPKSEYNEDEHILYEFFEDLPEEKKYIYKELIKSQDLYSVMDLITIAKILKCKVLEYDGIILITEILKDHNLRESAQLFGIDIDLTSEEIELHERIISKIVECDIRISRRVMKI